MEISVVNKHHIHKHPRLVRRNYIYCGRGSILGNPFKIDKTNTRDDVVDMYKEHFYKKTEDKDKDMVRQLNNIIAIGHKYGSIGLVCYCAPKRCHCDVIKEYLLEQINE